MLKYHHHFEIWNLRYKLYSDSKKIIRYFKRLYSLFNDCNGYDLEDTPIKNVLLRHRSSSYKRSIKDIIRDINSKIYNTWMKNFTKRVLFLHASSVELSKNYLLFIGGPRSGKSTIVAVLRDNNAHIFSDDFTPIQYKRTRILNFPIFSNIRKGEPTNLQKKHLNLLKPYFERFDTLRREHIIDMSKEEFKAYYSYNKELYNLKFNYTQPFKNKKIIGIFLKRNNNNILRLQRVTFPQSLNMFINSIHIPRPIFRKNFKSIIRIFGDIDFYTLESDSVKKVVELISANFK